MTSEPATTETSLLLEAVQGYLDALYSGDAELFAKIMHPKVRLYCPTPDPPLEMDLNAYLDLVRGRPSPAQRNDPRLDRVLSVAIATPTTAHVRLQDAYLPRLFTDELTFIRSAGGPWQVISKVWHFEVVGDEELAAIAKAALSR
jgi:putative lumazine-binding protein